MPHISIPHLDLPFRFVSDQGSLTVATVEQDTIDDVANCVQAVLRCPTGFRPELPEFGLDDLTFRMLPIEMQEILDAVLRWEPRAQITMEKTPEVLDELVVNLFTYVSQRKEDISVG